MKIDDSVIAKIEEVFGFTLYDWQKDYLLGKRDTKSIGRRNGKTFAYIVKLLISDGIKLTYRDLKMYCVEDDDIQSNRYGNAYQARFAQECLRINDVLIENGFETRIIE